MAYIGWFFSAIVCLGGLTPWIMFLDMKFENGLLFAPVIFVIPLIFLLVMNRKKHDKKWVRGLNTAQALVGIIGLLFLI